MVLTESGHPIDIVSADATDESEVPALFPRGRAVLDLRLRGVARPYGDGLLRA